MSSCLIRSVRSVELVVSNLSEAARFYEDVWQLAPVEMPPPNPPPHAREGRGRNISAARAVIITCSGCISARSRR
jgi:hypothetical protein